MFKADSLNTSSSEEASLLIASFFEDFGNLNHVKGIDLVGSCEEESASIRHFSSLPALVSSFLLAIYPKVSCAAVSTLILLWFLL